MSKGDMYMLQDVSSNNSATVRKNLDPDFVMQVAIEYKEATDRIRKLEAQIKDNESVVALANTLVNTYVDSEYTMTVGTFVDMLNKQRKETNKPLVRLRKAFEWFRDEGFLTRNSNGRHVPTQLSIQENLFMLKEYITPSGYVTNTVAVLTAEGIEFFKDLL